jgi:hypothetical protein
MRVQHEQQGFKKTVNATLDRRCYLAFVYALHLAVNGCRQCKLEVKSNVGNFRLIIPVSALTHA